MDRTVDAAPRDVAPRDAGTAPAWRRREPPLAPGAVAARGSAASRLAGRAAALVESGVALRVAADGE